MLRGEGMEGSLPWKLELSVKEAVPGCGIVMDSL